tara:strand:- start:1377 stop:1757 length:381 start_codon:yes stop_codon:yes gene_type:complete
MQLFHSLPSNHNHKIEKAVEILVEAQLINVEQIQQWIDLFLGNEVPNQLRWLGSLQEGYYLFNELRKASLEASSRITVITKNGGLDWVKINKGITTKYGAFQKESRPKSNHSLSKAIDVFISINFH